MNYPPSTWEGDPDAPWNQSAPTCHACKAEGVSEGEECPDCGEYQPTDDDLAEEAAEREYDRMRDGW